MAFMEAYVIPTPSMEHSLLVGDFLSKQTRVWPKNTQTPLQLPLPMPRSGELIFPLFQWNKTSPVSTSEFNK